MINFNDKEFLEVKEKSIATYNTVRSVYCPYFKEKIYFGAQALEHLSFKRREQVRPEKDQYRRLKLLYLAPEILKLSHTVQGILETKKFERIRVHGRTDTILKPVTYYEFIAVMKRNRVRLIIKQMRTSQQKNRQRRVLCWVFGYSLKAVRGRTLQTPTDGIRSPDSKVKTSRLLKSRRIKVSAGGIEPPTLGL
jgi:hypothetical protein